MRRCCSEFTWNAGLWPSRFSALPVLLAFYSVIQCGAHPREATYPIQLPNLPPSWRGRTAALVSDLHLGHIRNRRFLRRIVGMLTQLRPDILFIPGDLFDGTQIDADRLAEPWAAFSAPLGAYFVTGNHEQFSSPDQYLEVVRQSGIRVLENEKIDVDGLQIVGVHYRDSTNPERFRSILKNAGLDPAVASILLIHTPDRMPVAARRGHYLAAFRAYPPRTVFSFYAGCFADLRPVRLRIEPPR